MNLKSATKPFNVLIACTRPLITELSDKLRLKHRNHPKYADLLIAKKLASVYSRVFL